VNRVGFAQLAWIAAALSWIVASFVACGGPPARVAPRRSTAPKVPWREFDEAKKFPEARAPFTSLGHGALNYSIDVRVDPAHLEAYRTLSPGGALSPGAIVIATHQSQRVVDATSVYVMMKHAPSTWEFLVLDADGVVDTDGDRSLCERCHAEAPADHLFGLPRFPSASGADGGASH
jgi:hypothetical protein